VEGNLRGKISWIIVVAEGAIKADDLARQITEMTSLETRAVVLGHIQRGGRPTAFSRTMAAVLGEAAVQALLKGQTDKVVGMKDGKMITVDLEYAIKKKDLEVDRLYSLIKILT
jgi:6-phosphofructokinase 1